MTNLVLLPGLLCDARLWAHQAESLADVAAVSVADLTQHDSVTAMALAVLDDAPETFALAGLSMGGYVAQEIMRLAPHRVERLALLDTSARRDTDEQLARRQRLVDMAQLGKFKGVTPKLLPFLILPDRLEDQWLSSTVMAMAENVGQDAYLRQQRAIMGRVDSVPSLAHIDCPTLVVCGRQDGLTPLERSEEIADGIPGAKLVVIEECGHLSTLERPHAVSAVMRYWLQA